MNHLVAIFVFLTLVHHVAGFLPKSPLRTSSATRNGITARNAPQMMSQHLNIDWISLVSGVEAVTKPEDYQYGAVNAPSWALPLGAVLVILTAALPLLLRPGEEALEEQRENERIKGSEFNKKKGTKL